MLRVCLRCCPCMVTGLRLDSVGGNDRAHPAAFEQGRRVTFPAQRWRAPSVSASVMLRGARVPLAYS
eukprot:2916030-Lingulodinium_polyedra.AAC.1